jgi:hypothetical protein
MPILSVMIGTGGAFDEERVPRPASPFSLMASTGLTRLEAAPGGCDAP